MYGYVISKTPPVPVYEPRQPIKLSTINAQPASPAASLDLREREREIQIVHSASLAFEDESVFTFCALLRMAVRQWLTAF